RSPLTLSPAPMRGFFFAGRPARPPGASGTRAQYGPRASGALRRCLARPSSGAQMAARSDSAGLPPAEYDHPFDGEVVVFDELDEKALQRECGRAINLRPGGTAIACAPMGGPGKKCVVHIGERRLACTPEQFPREDSAARNRPL